MNKDVDLVGLDQNSDTSDAMGRLLINMLGSIGQFEIKISAERQKDGIKRAKDRGVHFGRRPAFAADQVTERRQKRKQRRQPAIRGNTKGPGAISKRCEFRTTCRRSAVQIGINVGKYWEGDPAALTSSCPQSNQTIQRRSFGARTIRTRGLPAHVRN